ncbi:hypothetical protein SO694_00109097 [Aureococcus anophagefferens]|uniref:Uncharacterized protein n=1 Tax=Aureococcus anophagefferens TaxID=44056 RepID=A0ABR1FM62_AURAN
MARRRRAPPVRRALGDDGRVSNHHIKIVATLAALGEPSIRGAYYADLDTSVAHPWVVGGAPWTSTQRGASRTWTFNYDAPSGPAKVAAFRWQVRSSHFYARDSVAGRAFFARWFANRCTFKDQFSLFHTILELADDAGCIDYRGEADAMPGLDLPKRGARACSRHATPNLIDALYHRSLAGRRDAQVFAFDGGNITVAIQGSTRERDSQLQRLRSRPFSTRRERRASPRTLHALENTTKCVSYDPGRVAKLGIRARDRTRHAWG